MLKVSNNRASKFASLRGVAVVRRGVSELKVFDIGTTTSQFVLNAAVAAIPLCVPGQGVAINTRVGNKIGMKSLHLNAMVVQNGAGGAQAQEALRCIVFWDRQPNGVAPLWNELINTQAAALTMDGLNLNYRDRFSVLADNRFYTPSTSAANVDLNPQPSMKEFSLNRFIRLQDRESVFKGVAGTVSDCSTGALFIIFQGSIGNNYSLTWTCRSRFRDA